MVLNRKIVVYIDESTYQKFKALCKYYGLKMSENARELIKKYIREKSHILSGGIRLSDTVSL